jgi:hypothetical protein
VKRGEMIRQEARHAGFRTGSRVETGRPGVASRSLRNDSTSQG